MEIRIVQESISLEELQRIAKGQFGNFVKAVVDVRREVMAIGGELHADEEVLLSEDGSQREDMWGVNIYPDKSGDEWIEFDSMINLKPHFGNRSRDVESPEIRKKIRAIIRRLVVK
ncbi:MAG: hypothetical protein HYT82_00645 [Candidatus Harrisonbacteria bacterium]|nr:hypothetical protein [Candidatus Harrisonbacteria bacterium]MBI2406504.1 hypothetical protein [Candidatus Harrisonbacteria bacterium]